MRAGELDRRIVVETITDAVSSSGAPYGTISNFATVFASVKPIRGAETLGGDMETPLADTRFRIRPLSGLTAKHRIRYGADRFDIVEIKELGRGEGLEILAKSGAEMGD